MMKLKDKPVVLVTEGVYKRGKFIFDAVEDMQIVVAPSSENTLAGEVKTRNAFAVVLGGERYEGPLYEAMNKGGLLARFGVGYDGIQFDKAKEKGLVVTNTPGVLESTVAEFTLFLAGEVLRKCGAISEEMKKGVWRSVMGSDLDGKTWAILGLGSIGKRLCKILAKGFGIRVVGFKSNLADVEKIKEECGAQHISSDYAETVSGADIISLHLPASLQTHHFLDGSRLARLKRGAVLINTGRGVLVDENALFDALQTGALSGAGLDVFHKEPYEPLDPERDLRKLPNVVMTPHLASSTHECARRMTLRVLQNLRYAITGDYNKMDIVPG